MKRVFHVRFWERPKGRFLWPTRPFAPAICNDDKKATKVAVGIVPSEGAEPDMLKNGLMKI